MEEKIKYGFYSEQAAQHSGEVVYYKTIESKTVIITCVCDDREGIDYCWDDKVYCGQFVTYLGRSDSEYLLIKKKFLC